MATNISKEKVKKLISEFETVDYFSFKDSYKEIQVIDLSLVITSMTINEKTKIIRHDHGDLTAPKKLTDLENKIDEIVNSSQWIY